jgi:hypothetical protein
MLLKEDMVERLDLLDQFFSTWGVRPTGGQFDTLGGHF